MEDEDVTFGMRIRLWYAQVGTAERGAGIGAAAAMAALLVLLLLPVTDGGAQSTLGSGDPGLTGSSGTGTTSGSATGGSSGLPGGSVGTVGTTGASGGSSGTTGTGPGQTSGSGSSGAGSITSTGTAGSGTGGSPNISRVASDQGVTASTLKVGFLIANTGGISGSGFALGLRTDQDKVIKAYVDWINKHGGVAGRKLTYVTALVDPLSASNQRAACLKMTEEDKVFAVIDTSTTLGATELCYGAQHKTPFFGTGLGTISAAYVKQSFPYQVSIAGDGTRQVLNWAYYAQSIGLFKGHKLGILADQCAPDPDIISKDLKPVLAKFGVTPLVVSLSCDPSTAQQQIPSAVLQMQRAKVDLVLPATIFTNVQVFLQNAQSQLYKPTYTASDWFGMTIDLFTQNFPAQQWNGTRGITASTSYKNSLTKPGPAVRDCNNALKAEGVPTLTNYKSDSEALVYCDGIHLLQAALAKAGVNPTRLSWARAVQTLGSLPAASVATAIYGQGDTEGGDTLGVTQWGSDCKCYSLVTPITRRAYV